MGLATVCGISQETIILISRDSMRTSLLESILTPMPSVSWCLGLAPPLAPTCPPAPDCGAPPQGARNMAARPSTCPGLMELLVERTSGA